MKSIDSNIHNKISKILFYFTLDEEYALFSAKKIYDNYKKAKASSLEFSACIKPIYESMKKYSQRKNSIFHIKLNSCFQIPRELDLEAWREYIKRSDFDEIAMVCLSQIGEFSYEEINSRLGFESGYVKFHLNKGLKTLGGILLKEFE